MSKHNSSAHLNEDGLILSGYQKKLKTMKKKFFVLYKDTLRNAARLEYYDNDRKFKAGLAPKRVIKLKNCFNINRRLDTKHDFVIALSTKDSAFGIVFETKDVMQEWLENFIALQRSDTAMSDTLRPHFEHVWQVLVQRKGLAENKGIVGNYHVCLTAKSLTFIRIGPEKMSGDTRISNIEFLLTTIRRCGDSHCFFYMEVGRQSIIGPGELWMETEDSLTAQNMHHMILCAMSEKNETSVEPMRKRSSSANEASKPINVIHRRQTQQADNNKGNTSPQASLCFGRERCDSLPSRNRTSSECSNQSFNMSTTLSMRNNAVHRSQSYQRHSNSPPMSNIGCSESEESSQSIDEPDDNGPYMQYRFNSRSSEGVIPEENTDELVSCENKSADNLNHLDCGEPAEEQSYMSMAPLKSHKDLEELSNSINKQRDDAVSISAVQSNSILEFPEYSSDNVTKICNNDLNTQTELPARTYSIGSKFEHSKLTKRYGNLNDGENIGIGGNNSTTVRVRAFSVGSRAKIPRCDLQRGVLYPKAVISEQQNFNSNNNLFNVTDPQSAYNAMLSIAVEGRDKKSTSAPLLIHKSHNSVDHMSDLMEIDFSTKPQSPPQTTPAATKVVNLNQNRAYQAAAAAAKVQFGNKALAGSLEQNNKRLDSGGRSSTPPPQDGGGALIVKPQQMDNGYLEMKPLGCGGPKQQSQPVPLPSNQIKNISQLLPALAASADQTAPIAIPKTLTAAYARVATETLSASPKSCNSTIAEEQINAVPTTPTTTMITKASLGGNKYTSLATQYGQLSLDAQDGDRNTTAAAANCVELKKKKTLTNHSRKTDEQLLATTPNAKCNKAGGQRKSHGDRTTTPNITTANSMEKLTATAPICPTAVAATTTTTMTMIPPNNLHALIVGVDKKAMTLHADKEISAGYEILQIKSDSSLLPANKHYQRPSSIRKEKQQQQQQQLIKAKTTHLSTDSSIASAALATAAQAAAISTSTLPSAGPNNCRLSAAAPTSPSPATAAVTATPNLLAQLSAATSQVAAATVAAAVAAAVVAPSAALSRPPSVSSEQGLYYASLDLPPCSGNEPSTAKMCKTIETAAATAAATTPAATAGTATTSTSGVAAAGTVASIPDVNNSYAKIDFDHSDSSSSSSKNMNI